MPSHLRGKFVKAPVWDLTCYLIPLQANASDDMLSRLKSSLQLRSMGHVVQLLSLTSQ